MRPRVNPDSSGSSPSSLVFRDGQVTYLTACVDVTACWTGPLQSKAPGILAFYEQALGQLGDRPLTYRTETMGLPRRLEDRDRQRLPHALSDPSADRDFITLFLESGAHLRGTSDWAFAFQHVASLDPPVGYVRLVMPATVAEEPDAFASLADGLVKTVDFDWGIAGYAVNYSAADERLLDLAENDLYGLVRKYVGLDIPTFNSGLFAIARGIKCVNWLTYLGRGYADSVESLLVVSMRSAQSVKVRKIRGGLVVQAGHSPRLGNSNRGDTLPEYRAVGHALASIRARGFPPFLKRRGSYDEVATEEWLSRFDSIGGPNP